MKHLITLQLALGLLALPATAQITRSISLTENGTVAAPSDFFDANAEAISAAVAADFATAEQGALADSSVQVSGNGTLVSPSNFWTANKQAILEDLELEGVENVALSTWSGSGNLTTLGTVSSGSIPWNLIASPPTTLSGYGISDAQPLSTSLSNIAALSGTGLAARTGNGTWSTRTITGTTGQITVTNGDGVSGNPTLSLPSTITGDRTFDGNTTAGTASGQSFTINAGTVTAPNANSVGSTNIANVGTLDARFRNLTQDLLGFSFNHRGHGFAVTSNGTMGSNTSYSTGFSTYSSSASSSAGDFSTDSGSFVLGNGVGLAFVSTHNHIWSWLVGAATNNSATSLVFMVGGNATTLTGKDPTTRSLGVTITGEVVSNKTQYILWVHNGTSLVGSATVSLASPRLYTGGGRMSLVYSPTGPTLKLYFSAPNWTPTLIASLSGAEATWGGDIPTRGFVVRHYVNTGGVVNIWNMSDLRWISEPTTIP